MQGTIKQLTGKITLNGHTLDAPSLSVLTRLGEGSFARKVGTVPKPEGQKGRSATIWELDDNFSASLAHSTQV